MKKSLIINCLCLLFAAALHGQAAPTQPSPAAKAGHGAILYHIVLPEILVIAYSDSEYRLNPAGQLRPLPKPETTVRPVVRTLPNSAVRQKSPGTGK
jgi:hypothetical protein